MEVKDTSNVKELYDYGIYYLKYKPVGTVKYAELKTLTDELRFLQNYKIFKISPNLGSSVYQLMDDILKYPGGDNVLQLTNIERVRDLQKKMDSYIPKPRPTLTRQSNFYKKTNRNKSRLSYLQKKLNPGIQNIRTIKTKQTFF